MNIKSDNRLWVWSRHTITFYTTRANVQYEKMAHIGVNNINYV